MHVSAQLKWIAILIEWLAEYAPAYWLPFTFTRK
jgi:hypothetical protein